ncbi:thiamine-phosphate kinase [Parendozoicomonas haliclonae]|uniref:Thiamine-monophosphate kinase n=1 Tax=Parendozoicomonas haliclonae TaxID=1960125 RepID=A0A1X7AMJ0_9GAMM|nr:thiamine-phosphate kinase [Parendozoicomonas haliclonae]SMA49501.1 Thiamine-monophosphate kinase [Parendozoicomonas haliclonae]
MDEFSLIRNIFQQPQLTEAGSVPDQGIGDDCSLISLPADQQLVQSIDTLVADVHFTANGDPYLIGYRALAVSVSDLAAMGAKPHSFSLALSLPENNPEWLQRFADGLAAMANAAGISLIGGDTTRGPLTISVHVQGIVPKGKALLRSGARPGDLIYVSGTPGEANAALPYILGEKAVTSDAEQHLVDRYWQPTPRIALGQWLLENGATSALDVSDGLSGDLSHILRASNCGAELFSEKLPVSDALAEVCGDEAIDKVLNGGDDYELCFIWPAGKPMTAQMSEQCPTPVTCIGHITKKKGLWLDGQSLEPGSYNHFSN